MRGADVEWDETTGRYHCIFCNTMIGGTMEKVHASEHSHGGQEDVRHQLKDERLPDGRLVTATGAPLTMPEFFDLFGIEYEITDGEPQPVEYEVTRRNHWEQSPGVWLNQLRLKPRPSAVDLEVIRNEVASMQRLGGILYAPRTSNDSFGAREIGGTEREAGVMVEIDVMDLHLSMLAWADETGHGNYDSDIARYLFLDSVRSLAARALAAYNVVYWVLPIGNDILHTDSTTAGKGGQTTKGTPQDVDTRWKKVFVEAREMIVQAVMELREYAPVDVIIVPGNHDFERSFMLGDSLAGWLSNVDGVSVNNEPTSRKYLRFGSTFIGYTHGNEETKGRLPMLLATERPDLWAKSEFREWHLGHIHRKMEEEFQGVMLRHMYSLTAPDEWHARRGFVMGRRAAEAHVYDWTEGEVARFTSSVTKSDLDKLEEIE